MNEALRILAILGFGLSFSLKDTWNPPFLGVVIILIFLSIFVLTFFGKRRKQKNEK